MKLTVNPTLPLNSVSISDIMSTTNCNSCTGTTLSPESCLRNQNARREDGSDIQVVAASWVEAWPLQKFNVK
jgi:hypothetical protein